MIGYEMLANMNDKDRAQEIWDQSSALGALNRQNYQPRPAIH
jgi:hypothetical protein